MPALPAASGAAAALFKVVRRFVPTPWIEAIAATAISAAIKPYSTADAPLSLLTSLRTNPTVASLADLFGPWTLAGPHLPQVPAAKPRTVAKLPALRGALDAPRSPVCEGSGLCRLNPITGAYLKRVANR